MGTAYEQNPTVTFTDSTNYTVTFVAISSSGCKDTVVKNVTVHSLPAAVFDFSPKFGAQTGELINFENNSGSANSYLWYFGDGSSDTSATPSHAYSDTGIYDITLYAFNSFGCVDSISLPIDVRPPSIDVAVLEINASCQSDFIEDISVMLVNNGTREITAMDLYAQVEGSDPVREQWVGLLEPGNSTVHSFVVSFPIKASNVNYWCVWLENPNGMADEVPSNDKQCKACRNDFVLLEPFPNPAQTEINFWFILPKDEPVTGEIFDGKGAYVGTAFSGQGCKGLNQFVFNAGILPKGMYTLRFNYFESIYHKSFVIH